MEWLTMALASEVVFVSESLAREAQRRRLIRPGRGWLVGAGSSNGVNAAAVAARSSQVDASQLRGGLGFAADDFVVGFVGRVATDKGVDTILRALADPVLDPRARALVIGRVEDEALEREIAAFGHRVRVVAWTDDVWGHLPAMDVLCLPTKREGFPNVVLEAAAAGIPAIVTDATGAVDSVIDGETGYLTKVGDAAALVRQINRLAADPGLTARLGQAARQRAGRDFVPERIWQGVLSITDGRDVTSDVRHV
jgi:glycosyltransferase involved in cell wall biosynthesis